MAQFECDICGAVFNHRGDLNAHKKNAHGPKVRCGQCGKLLAGWSLANHERRMHNGWRDEQDTRQRKCVLCHALVAEGSVWQHMRTAHAGRSYHMCDYCEFVSARQRDLKEHERSAHWKRRWYCCVAGCRNVKGWADRTGAQYHLRKQHAITASYNSHLVLRDTAETPAALTKIRRVADAADTAAANAPLVVVPAPTISSRPLACKASGGKLKSANMIQGLRVMPKKSSKERSRS